MMPEYSTNEDYAKSIRLKISSAAKAMLENEMSFLSGARTLSALRNEIPGGTHDSDFMTFVAIDSETAHFPLDETRQYWDKQALDQLQPEIQTAEVWAREFGTSACASLLRRFGE